MTEDKRGEETQFLLEQQLSEVAKRHGISVDQLVIEVYMRANRDEESRPCPDGTA